MNLFEKEPNFTEAAGPTETGFGTQNYVNFIPGKSVHLCIQVNNSLLKLHFSLVVPA